MLGKRFQRTVSMAQIRPSGTTCNSNSEKAAAAPGTEEQQAISQWEILKHAEEMMMMMMGAAAPRTSGGSTIVPSESAGVSSTAHAEAANFPSPSLSDHHQRPADLIPRVNFLDNCFFCNRRLKHERDIFIYRGDAAFCTEECRQRQIMNDEMRVSASPSSAKKRGGGATSETAVAA